MSPDSAAPPVPPELLELYPDFRCIALVGEGGFGQVWLASAPDGHSFCALKLIQPPKDPSAPQREQRALHYLQTLSSPDTAPVLHPALCPILSTRGPSPSGAFAYAMPLADAERPNWTANPAADYHPRTLASELDARTALPVPELLDLALALASALEFLHARHLVHRDIKPANVIYLDGRPVLADVGLLADPRTAVSCVGTQSYAPPEGQGTPAADLYSLGLLLREALAGRPPAESFLPPLAAADSADPRFPALLRLVARLAEPDPRKRLSSATALLRFLRDLQNGTIPPALQPRDAPAPGRISRWLFGGLGVLLLLILAIGSFRIREQPPSATPPAPAPTLPPAPTPAPAATVPPSPEPSPLPEPPRAPYPVQPPQIPASFVVNLPEADIQAGARVEIAGNAIHFQPGRLHPDASAWLAVFHRGAFSPDDWLILPTPVPASGIFPVPEESVDTTDAWGLLLVPEATSSLSELSSPAPSERFRALLGLLSATTIAPARVIEGTAR